MPKTSASLKWQVHTFNTLTLEQLYAILRLRESVFVIEQNCVYQDLDNRDQSGEHILGLLGSKKELVAYARVLPPSERFEEPSIGRIIVRKDMRDAGLGRALVERSLLHCAHRYPGHPLRISAQQHLERFYQSLGFNTDSQPYDEDGIPHVEMLFSTMHAETSTAIS